MTSRADPPHVPDWRNPFGWLSRSARPDISAKLPRFFIVLTAPLALIACSGWEGPDNWLQRDFVVGKPGSACVPGDLRCSR